MNWLMLVTSVIAWIKPKIKTDEFRIYTVFIFQANFYSYC